MNRRPRRQAWLWLHMAGFGYAVGSTAGAILSHRPWWAVLWATAAAIQLDVIRDDRRTP